MSSHRAPARSGIPAGRAAAAGVQVPRSDAIRTFNSLDCPGAPRRSRGSSSAPSRILLPRRNGKLAVAKAEDCPAGLSPCMRIIARVSFEKKVCVHLINSIHIDPSKVRSLPELASEVKDQLKSSTRKFEKLKTTVSNLVKYTKDLRGFIDVELLEKKASSFNPNMDVVRSLRLVKYILSTMIYLTKGDEKYVESMKPDEEFFKTRPGLSEIVKTKKDVDTVLLSLYNEPPRKFIADYSPLYDIKGLLEEILVTKSRRVSPMGSHSFYTQSRQFEESMCMLTGAVLRLLFNVEESDTDMDIMQYFVKSNRSKPVRLKRVFADDVRRVHKKIDHSLFLLNEAANCVLQETEKDPSFIQQILNQSYLANVRESSKGVLKDADALVVLLDGLSGLKTEIIHLCWTIREKTSEATRRMNALMDSSAYRDLLLLSRDMKEVGNVFFAHLHDVYGFFAALAAQNKVGLVEFLNRLDESFTSHFSLIDDYLTFLPGFEKKLDSFRKSYGQLTLIEEGRSEFYRTIIHEVSQVYMNFTTSVERGKIFHRYLALYEDLDLLFDPLYGDKIRNITGPIIELRETFPPESKFNLARFIGTSHANSDVMRNSYRKIMRVQLCAEAILGFYGNLLENGRYMFDAAAVRQESAMMRCHLDEVVKYCDAHDEVHEEKETGAQLTNAQH
jgi:hypothetical protein